VRVVVPLTPGGGVDILARIIADHFSQVLGQRFIVDNRPGAGGSIGVETVAKAAPDGHTVLVSSSSMVTNAAIQSVRYDPIRDFQPVTKLTSNAYILLTTTSLPVSSVKELVALARSRPGNVTYASSGTGGVLHLGAELLCALAGVQMNHVPYKGVADAYPAVISGQVNWVLGNPLSALPLLRAGRVKGIAVSGAARMKVLPDLPTIAESGVPGYSGCLVWPVRPGPRAAADRREALRGGEPGGACPGAGTPHADRRRRCGRESAAGICRAGQGGVREMALARRQGGTQNPVMRNG